MALGDLVVKLSADVAQFQSDMGRALHISQQNARAIQKAFDGVRNTLASIGAGVSVAGLVAFTKSAIDSADNLNKLSQKVGVTVESLSALKYAADLSDVSMEQLQTGLQKLAKGAAEAEAGTGDAAAAFNALKISVTGADGSLKSTEQLLLDVAEKFAGMQDGAGKTAIAMRIFGRSGAELIPFLNQGKTGIEELRKEAERLGIVMSGETARAAEQFNDDMKRLTRGSEALKVELATGLLPALNRTATAMLEAAKEGAGFLGQIKALSQLSPATDLFKSEREIVKLTDELLSTQAEIQRKRGSAGPDELKALEEHAARTEKRLRELQKLRGVLSGELDAFGDPAKPKVEPGKAKAPSLGGDGKEVDRQKEINKAYVTAAEQILGLDEASLKLRDEMLKKDDELRKAEEKLGDTMQEQVLKNIDTEQELYEERERTAGLLANSGKSMIEINEELAKGLKKENDIARDLGLTFSSAFEDAVSGGKKLGDVFRSLAQDLAKLAVRKLLTEPLFEAVQEAFKLSGIGGSGGSGGGLGGIFGGLLKSIGLGGSGGGATAGAGANFTSGADGLFGSFAVGTDYVPRTGPYELHQGEAVISAAENGARAAPVINVYATDAASFNNRLLQRETRKLLRGIIGEGYGSRGLTPPFRT